MKECYMGSNPVESPEFFRFMRQLLKLSSKFKIGTALLLQKKRCPKNRSVCKNAVT